VFARAAGGVRQLVVSFFVVRRAGQPDLACDVHFPEHTARAAVLLIHGHGEHQGCYREVIQAWRARGFAVAIFDLRGHGNSGGKRSHIQHFDDYLRDAHDVLSELQRDPRWSSLGPPIVFGHSLGALIAIQLVLSAQSAFRGLAMTSPYLGLAAKVSPFVLWLGRTLSKSWPSFSLSSPVQSRVLTHDAAKIAECEADALRTSAVTARFFTEVERAQALALAQAPDLRVPVCCMAAGDDRVVALSVTHEWFSRVGSRDKELRVMVGAFHELLNEVERVEYISAFADRFERWSAVSSDR